MQKIYLLLLVLVCGLLFQSKSAKAITRDTAKITHVLDGNTQEWVAEKMEKDKETEIIYAVDLDEKNVYVALKVPNQRLQMKMMMQGMNLYFDKKGKKREGTGIEFPIKRDRDNAGGFGGGRGARGPQGESVERPDMKEQREKLAIGMVFLKIFGFDGQEDKIQIINQLDGINISFDWDEKNVLTIEYLIPIDFIGKPNDLKGKTLSLGCKINGIDQPAPSGVRTEIVGVPAGGGRGGGSSGGGRSTAGGRGFEQSGGNTDSRNEFLKEQSFWTKINLNF